MAGHAVRHRDAEVHHGRRGHEFQRVGQRPRRGKGRDWKKPAGQYAMAQLSPWVLWPPGRPEPQTRHLRRTLRLRLSAAAAHAAKKTTAGKDVPTGDHCWTLFLNTGNFKGPVAFFTPYFWSQPPSRSPNLSGLFLDTRPSEPNKALQMETQHVPAFMPTTRKATPSPASPRRQFPAKAEARPPLVHRITSYSKAALWDGVEAWFDGGTAVPA